MQETIKVKGVIDFKIYARFDVWYKRLALNFLNLISQSLKMVFLEKYGIVKDAWTVNNLITSAGKAQLALLAGDATATPFTYLALGTSNTAPAVGQTTLSTEITDTGLARAVATISRITTNVANDTLQLLYTWTASGTKVVEECGIFNAVSVGTMLGRALTSTKTVLNGETIQVTYKVIFA